MTGGGGKEKRNTVVFYCSFFFCFFFFVFFAARRLQIRCLRSKIKKGRKKIIIKVGKDEPKPHALSHQEKWVREGGEKEGKYGKKNGKSIEKRQKETFYEICICALSEKYCKKKNFLLGGRKWEGRGGEGEFWRGEKVPLAGITRIEMHFAVHTFSCRKKKKAERQSRELGGDQT